MQTRPRILKILLVGLIASLLLGACYGGDSGRTWFNLPSAKVHVQPDGTAKVFGLNVGAVVDPALVQQLEAGSVEELEARAGYNGIHVTMNGEELPYIAWDNDSATNLQGLLGAMPTVPPQASQYLPWLRKVGLGAKLILPSSTGTTERWSGETVVTPETADDPVALNVGGIAFDESGNLVVAGLDSDALAAAAGGALPQLDAGTLGTLSSLGIDALNVKTGPNGIDLSFNGQSLPSIAYDSASLATLTKYLPGLTGGDPATADLVNQVVPMLPNLALNADVSFTGEPIGTLELPAVDVQVAEDGSLSAFGLPVGPAGTLDAATLGMLQDAGIGSLNLDVNDAGLMAVVNGQKLPSISWNDESIGALAGIAGAAAGQSPDTIEGLLNLVRGSGLNANVVLPGGEAVDMATVDTTVKAADLAGLSAPTIHLDAVFDKSGALKGIGDISADDLAGLGVAAGSAMLPPQLMDLMTSMGASTMNISTEANKLNIAMDGTTALSIDYDTDSLANVLNLASAFAGDSILSDPAMSKLLTEQILPLLPGSDLNVNVSLE